MFFCFKLENTKLILSTGNIQEKSTTLLFCAFHIVTLQILDPIHNHR